MTVITAQPSLAIENGRILVTDENGRHFTIDPATQQVTGDARGCDGGTSDGYSYLAARSIPGRKSNEGPPGVLSAVAAR
jgi:hypothetical protein